MRLTEVPLCIHCRYYLLNRDDAKLSAVECSHPCNQEQDYVKGGIKHFYISAQSLRLDSQYCGPTGIHWERKL